MFFSKGFQAAEKLLYSTVGLPAYHQFVKHYAQQAKLYGVLHLLFHFYFVSQGLKRIGMLQAMYRERTVCKPVSKLPVGFEGGDLLQTSSYHPSGSPFVSRPRPSAAAISDRIAAQLDRICPAWPD